jgi:hypothetical protein
MPYVAPQRYLLLNELTTYPFYFGHCRVVVLHPLLSSSSLTVPPVSVSFNLSFVDPEVAGLTSNSLTPMFKQLKHKMRPQGKEQVLASNQGYLSSALNKVSQISAMMTSLPFVGGVASAVSPITGVLANVAKSFGYDKPADLKTPCKELVTYQPQLTKGVGVDQVDVISLYPDNAVSAEPGYFVDEADFTQITNYARLPGLIGINNWTSLTDGQVLGYIPVAPGFANYTTATGPIYTYDTTPVMAVASLFKYWTGGLKYAIKISTSSFVSWRLRVTFVPDNNYNTAPDPGNGDYTSRIVDINGDCTITFTIPYIGITEYLHYAPAHLLVDNTAGPAYLPVTTIGQIILSVANAPTYTASTVAPTIYSTVWVAGAEDFRVAGPNDPDQVNKTVNLGFSSSEVFPQGIQEDSEMPRRLFTHTFEPLTGTATSIIKSGIVMGEEVASLLTLGHRYTQNISWYNALIGNNSTVYVRLYDNMVSGRAVLDTKTFIRQMFMFSRGSLRYQILLRDPTAEIQSGYIEDTPLAVGSFTLTNAEISNSGVSLVEAYNGTMSSVQIPFYSPFPLVNNKFNVQREVKSLPILRMNINWTSANSSNNLKIWESFADDYSLGWPKTPLPIIYDYSSLVTNGNPSKEEVQGVITISNVKEKKGGNQPFKINGTLL